MNSVDLLINKIGLTISVPTLPDFPPSIGMTSRGISQESVWTKFFLLCRKAVVGTKLGTVGCKHLMGKEQSLELSLIPK